MPARTRIIALILAVAAVGAVAFAASMPAQAQQTTTVAVGDFWFCSSAFESEECVTTIDAGDTVVWDFSGAPSTHTTTGAWDSGNVNGGTFSFTFDEAGEFAYHCSIHPTLMLGRIVVEAGPDEPVDSGDDEPADEPADGSATAVPSGGEGLSPVVPKTGFGPEQQSTNGWWMGVALGAAGIALAGMGALAYRRSRS